MASWISIKTGDGVVWLLRVESRKGIAAKVALIPCVDTSVEALAFSPDSSLLAVGDGNGGHSHIRKRHGQAGKRIPRG